MAKEIMITDHSLVRWLERVGGIDMDYFRSYIRTLIDDALTAGATSITIDGFTYALEPKERKLITVLANDMREKHKKKSKAGVDRKYGDRDDDELSWMQPDDYFDEDAA